MAQASGDALLNFGGKAKSLRGVLVVNLHIRGAEVSDKYVRV